MGYLPNFIDFGFGRSLQPPEVLERLFTMGLKKGGWVTLRNNPVGERGCGVLVSDLKQVGIRTEVEDNGNYGTPSWFSLVDRSVVWYSKNSRFDYGALRAKQDMLIYRGVPPKQTEKGWISGKYVKKSRFYFVNGPKKAAL